MPPAYSEGKEKLEKEEGFWHGHMGALSLHLLGVTDGQGLDEEGEGEAISLCGGVEDAVPDGP